jgi:hypothetical protein
LPAQAMPIATLLYRDLNLEDPTFSIPCVAIEQTLAEKVLSFLRRWIEAEKEQGQDYRRIRHIHDVHVLISDHLDMNKIEHVFELAVAEDVEKFATSNTTFAADPKEVLEKALRNASDDSGLSDQYMRFVEELVAGDAPPFDDALSTFSRVATQLIDSLA